MQVRRVIATWPSSDNLGKSDNSTDRQPMRNIGPLGTPGVGRRTNTLNHARGAIRIAFESSATPIHTRKGAIRPNDFASATAAGTWFTRAAFVLPSAFASFKSANENGGSPARNVYALLFFILLCVCVQTVRPLLSHGEPKLGRRPDNHLRRYRRVHHLLKRPSPTSSTIRRATCKRSLTPAKSATCGRICSRDSSHSQSRFITKKLNLSSVVTTMRASYRAQARRAESVRHETERQSPPSPAARLLAPFSIFGLS